MTLKEAIASGFPFKAKYQKFWFNPSSYPAYLDEAKEKNWNGGDWETGTFEELEKQNKELGRIIYD